MDITSTVVDFPTRQTEKSHEERGHAEGAEDEQCELGVEIDLNADPDIAADRTIASACRMSTVTHLQGDRGPFYLRKRRHRVMQCRGTLASWKRSELKDFFATYRFSLGGTQVPADSEVALWIEASPTWKTERVGLETSCAISHASQ